MITPIYPKINVPLAGEDGNAFAILARVRRIMFRAGLTETEWQAFHQEATSGDYNNLLLTVMSWFTVNDAPTMESLSERMEYEYDDDGDATLPCDECGVPVDADIHAEELGMCVECSNEYYDHSDEEN